MTDGRRCLWSHMHIAASSGQLSRTHRVSVETLTPRAKRNGEPRIIDAHPTDVNSFVRRNHREIPSLRRKSVSSANSHPHPHQPRHNRVTAVMAPFTAAQRLSSRRTQNAPQCPLLKNFEKHHNGSTGRIDTSLNQWPYVPSHSTSNSTKSIRRTGSKTSPTSTMN